MSSFFSLVTSCPAQHSCRIFRGQDPEQCNIPRHEPILAALKNSAWAYGSACSIVMFQERRSSVAERFVVLGIIVGCNK